MSKRENQSAEQVAEKSFLRHGVSARFEKTGLGPVVNGVRVQYSCGMDGFKNLENTYGTRRKGYGKPKHSWGSLLRVFTYFKEDLSKAIVVLIVTLVSIAITLLGTFLSAPLVDALLTPASTVAAGGSLASYESTVIANSMGLYGFLYHTVDWSAENAAYQAMNTTGVLMLIMVGLYVVSFGLSLIQAVMMTKLGTSALQRMRDDMFSKLQNLPVSYFDNTPHGDVMSRFTNDVDNISMLFINGLVSMFTDVITIIGILAFIFILDWLLALIAVFVECIAIAIVAFNVHRSVSAFSETQVSMGEFNGFAEETLSGLKVIKCFSKEKDMSEIFKSIDYRHTLHNARSTYMSSMNIPIVNNLNNFATALIAILGAVFVVLSAEGSIGISGFTLSVGTLISFVSFLRMFSRPFNNLSNQMTMVQSSLAGAERIFQMMDQEPELSREKAKWRSFKAEDGRFYWTDGKVAKPVRGEVVLDHVNFSYVPGQPVLKDICLYAKPGQRIALVGSTGAGKTTITNMLTRFYDIDSGTITIDGIDLKDIDRVSMRRSMTLVLQDTHLFTGTIYDNIRFGHLKATDEDCQRAAKIACADQFIEKLPDGYNTVISGTNASLSQGQKQLLSIARCAVSNPPILILDEATSSVDTRTERLISRGMDNIMRGKTTFVIAHRLSTIRYSDCIMVMDHGRIIERGTHDQLLAQKGAYYELWTGKRELD